MIYETMLECLRQVCPTNLLIEHVKDMTTKYKITFSYEGDKATAELPKTCAPNCHIKVCKQCVATAMSTIMFNRQCYDSASKWLEWPYLPEPSKGMSVCKLMPHHSGGWDFKTLYEFIDNTEDAYLLAQLAMDERKDHSELIFIFPGHNIDIKNKPHLYDEAIELKAAIEEKMKD